MANSFKQFFTSQSGSITTDWIVLVAGLTFLCVVSLATISNGAVAVSETAADEMQRAAPVQSGS